MADLEITQEITVELDGNSPFEYIVVKQGDKNSRIIAVTLLQNKQPYTIPSGCTARIKYFKPDGNPVLNDCTIQNNKVLVTYTAQMLAAAGTAKGEIVILQGEKELKSATFYTKITSAVYQTEGLVSDKEFLSMAEILVEMDQASEAAAENANIAAAAADNANTAANNVNTAVKNANAAATAANNAAAAGETATNSANTAATAANNAAAAGEAAANSANTAAGAANTAKNNADKATQAANTAAAAANAAATAGNAAAAACEGIAAGINTIPDVATGYTYTIGIENGKMYLERTE